MNNLFHVIGVVAVSLLVSAGMLWAEEISVSNFVESTSEISSAAPSTVQSITTPIYTATPTVVVVYPPTSDNPVYNIVIAYSNAVTQSIVIVPP
jgi:hypothetical protein